MRVLCIVFMLPLVILFGSIGFIFKLAQEIFIAGLDLGDKFLIWWTED